ncbi:MAG: FprA family A-type flavoprotein [Lachnospiraceae bacterium]|nr:FprA family A-type flavoprotein [Lachnospiraceae bacterium]
MNKMDVSQDILYIGADDTTLDLFESQYPVPEGISYNSYVIMDDKIAVMDTVDARGSETWQKALAKALGDKEPSYLIVQHLEPDHSANIAYLAEKYPAMQLVGTAKTKQMIPQFFEEDLSDRFVVVGEGNTLELGHHTLQFLMAPMIHWPEVMMTYEQSEKVFFTADAFGTFGAICNDVPWEQEASHYYLNIVGKYGASVQTLLKKAAALDIQTIAPLHGPVLRENLSFYLDKYNTWSSYGVEKEGVLICYASIHGNTKRAVCRFADELQADGVKVKLLDLTREHVSEGVEKCLQYGKIILAAVTYDGNLVPAMEDLLYHLECKNFQSRRVGLVENGSWAPVAAKKMREHLEGMKDVEICEQVVTIKTTRKAADQAAWDALKAQILA